MPMTIAVERPDTPDAIALINELQTHLKSFYPPESRHGFSVDKLIAQGVAFFVLRVDSQAVGCGGFLLVEKDYGELNRMYVRPEFRGREYGRRLTTSPRTRAAMASRCCDSRREFTSRRPSACTSTMGPEDSTVGPVLRGSGQPLLRDVAGVSGFRGPEGSDLWIVLGWRT